MITAQGRVVVLDFGIVSNVGDEEYGPRHEPRAMGTLSYMAPEQIMGEPLTAATDLYGVGTILYQVLTGRLPLEGSSEEIMTLKCLNEAPPL